MSSNDTLHGIAQRHPKHPVLCVIFRDFASRFYLILQFAAALDIFSNLMLHLVLMYLEWEGLKIIFQSFLYTSTQKAFALVKYQWKACVLPLEYFVPVLDGPSNRICLQS